MPDSEEFQVRFGRYLPYSICIASSSKPQNEDRILGGHHFKNNLIFISHNARAVADLESKVRKDFNSNGLPTHDHFDCVSEVDFVGLHLDGTRHETRIGWRRVWRLRLGIEYACSLPALSGHDIEVLVGHCT